MTPEDLKDLMFIDIETVSTHRHASELDQEYRKLWDKKAKQIDMEADSQELYTAKAAIFAEFGRVITIGMGFFHLTKTGFQFRTKALYSDDEAALLTEFAALIDKISKNNPKFRFVAHNGLEFDYPYLCRRMLVNAIPLPKPLQLAGKKSWDVLHFDTLELWKFGDRKNYTSLDLLAKVFGLPSSKSNMDGSLVGQYFYERGDLESIARYCLEDVVLTARVFLKLMQVKLDLPDEAIVAS